MSDNNVLEKDSEKERVENNAKQAVMLLLLKIFHLFITHNWGEEPGYANHALVAIINNALQEMFNLKTWFDSERLRDHLRDEMAKGIDQSLCVVVMITEVYRQKVNGPNYSDFCRQEFDYATNTCGPKKMVL